MRHLLGSYTWRTNCVGWESLQRFIIKTFVTHFSGSFFTLLPFWDFNYIPRDCAALMWTETIAGTTWCDIISLISDFIFCQSTYQMITVTSDQTREKPKQCFHIKQKCVLIHICTHLTHLCCTTQVFSLSAARSRWDCDLIDSWFSCLICTHESKWGKLHLC